MVRKSGRRVYLCGTILMCFAIGVVGSRDIGMITETFRNARKHPSRSNWNEIGFDQYLRSFS